MWFKEIALKSDNNIYVNQELKRDLTEEKEIEIVRIIQRKRRREKLTQERQETENTNSDGRVKQAQ